MPRKLTNKYGLPDVFEQAARADFHKKMGDVSVTELIDAPQIRHLKKNHDYYEDVSSTVWALLGTGVHHLLEHSQPRTYQAKVLNNFFSVMAEMKENMDEDKIDKVTRMEQFIKDNIYSQLPEPDKDRFDLERTMVMDWDGYKISGTRDVKDNEENKIMDYKVTSAKSLMYNNPYKKWAAQMNVYKVLSEENGETVDQLHILGIFKDWKHNEYMRFKDHGYPAFPIQEIPIEIVDREKMDKYISKQVERHRQADQGNVPECGPKERWKEDDQYAVMLEGGKKAVKGFNDEDFAKQYMESVKHKYSKKMYIEERPGTNKRCESFCPVRDVCPQYQKMNQ